MKLYVIDTNVILLAGTMIKDVPNDQLLCYQNCIVFLNNFMKYGNYVLVDDEATVLKEYKSLFRLIPYPNMAANFFQYSMAHMKFYHVVEKEENVFDNYPESKELKEFDAPDRKFIALAYGYKRNTSIVEAADSKWWGIKEELLKNGIDLIFIDEDYIRTKWEKKIGN